QSPHPPTAEKTALRMQADEEGQLDARQPSEQKIEPQLGAFAARRQIAPFPPPRIAITHRDDRDKRLIVKSVSVYPHPHAQTLSARVVPQNARGVDARAGRLTNDQNARR